MPCDTLSALQTSVTKTASFDSTGVDLTTMTPRRGLEARLIVTAASGTSPTLDVVIQHSSDNSTFTDLATFDQLTAVGEEWVHFATTKRYVRASATIGGTTPSFTYQVEICAARP